jgi:hypothetical protein
MVLFRRFSACISRISLTVIFISTSLFIIFGITKYLFKTDKQRFVPAGSALLKPYHHSHDYYQESDHTQRQV